MQAIFYRFCNTCSFSPSTPTNIQPDYSLQVLSLPSAQHPRIPRVHRYFSLSVPESVVCIPRRTSTFPLISLCIVLPLQLVLPFYSLAANMRKVFLPENTFSTFRDENRKPSSRLFLKNFSAYIKAKLQPYLVSKIFKAIFS